MNALFSSLLLAGARGLTLARLAGIPPFLWLLMHTDPAGPALLVLYLFIALSDALDGPLARKAGMASPLWGQLDAATDIAFNALSLSAAAWLGLVGPWVPAGVAVLAARFLFRNRGRVALEESLDEDRGGKIAGVVYYLLVGGIALELSIEGDAGRWAVARAGDGVFIYTMIVLLFPRRRPSAR